MRWLPPIFRPTEDELLPRTRKERTRRDWAIDVVLIGLSFAIGLAAHHAIATDKIPLEGWRSWIDLAGIPVAALALLWRRRWPLRVTLFVAAITLAAPSAGFATLVAAFAVAAYSPPTIALTGIGVIVVGSPISSWLFRHWSQGQWWSDALFGVIITIGVGAWGMFTGTRRQLLVSLQERARRAEAEQSMRVSQAREQERTRIAREMHDVLAHRMSLLSVHAGALEFRPDAPPADIARAAGVIRQTAHEALEELRTVIGVLRASDLVTTDDPYAELRAGVPEAPQPTLAELRPLVDEWRAAGARIELDLGVEPDEVPVVVGRTAYRVVQEGLTNAGKHAPAAKIDVRIAGVAGDALTIEVVNPLPVGGSAPSGIPGTGLGLVGLRERTALAGGRFEATADAAANRFLLRATLPWSAA